MNEDTFPHEKKSVWELKGDIKNIPKLNSHFVSWESYGVPIFVQIWPSLKPLKIS
jgi:hypothetical protein